MRTPDPATTPIAVAPRAVVASSAATRSAVIAVVVGALVAIALVAAVGGFSSPSSPSDVTATHTDDPHTSPDNASPEIAVAHQCGPGPVVRERDAGFTIARNGQAGEEIVWADRSGNVWHALVTTYGSGWYDAQCKALDSFP